MRQRAMLRYRSTREFVRTREKCGEARRACCGLYCGLCDIGPNPFCLRFLCDKSRKSPILLYCWPTMTSAILAIFGTFVCGELVESEQTRFRGHILVWFFENLSARGVTKR